MAHLLWLKQSLLRFELFPLFFILRKLVDFFKKARSGNYVGFLEINRHHLKPMLQLYHAHISYLPSSPLTILHISLQEGQFLSALVLKKM